MANRRMFSKTIIDSDEFLDLPLSSQALYFHLGIQADDDGFVNKPKTLQRAIGATKEDLQALIDNNFIILFQTGVIVITHWKIHNYIQSDRYKPTLHEVEKSMLTAKKNAAYMLMDTECIQDVYGMDTQYRLGKDRLELGKDRLELNKSKCIQNVYKPDTSKKYSDNLELNEAIIKFINYREKINKPFPDDESIDLFIKELNDLSELQDEQIKIITRSIVNGWIGIFPLPSKKENTSNSYIDAIKNRVSQVDDWV